MSDLSPDDDRRVYDLANYFRQARTSRPLDPWDWGAVAQEDVDRARDFVKLVDEIPEYYVCPGAEGWSQAQRDRAREALRRTIHEVTPTEDAPDGR